MNRVSSEEVSKALDAAIADYNACKVIVDRINKTDYKAHPEAGEGDTEELIDALSTVCHHVPLMVTMIKDCLYFCREVERLMTFVDADTKGVH